ncbi:valine--tRNA ligase [Nanoarchaeota archaeon]
MELPKRYDPKEEEPKWQKYWESKGTFVFDPTAPGEIYSVDTPPPTVSGKMHLGHAFSYSQQDFIIRFQRMRGKNVFYPFGTDDNGLPTERLVEKEKKVRSTRMERQEFVNLCNETIKELKPKYIQAWKDIGLSADFTKSYSTINEHCQITSQAGFIDLFKKGFIYRQESPTVWCVNCQTAIAQADLEFIDMKSSFSDIIFHAAEDPSRELVISTTRPELIPACVALFFHPDDKRYQNLKGKKAKIPLFDYEVPILTDETVDLEKGTGLMMVCTFGDKEDVDKWYRHKLDLRVVLEKHGLLNELAGEFNGMKIKEARDAIINKLEQEGFLKGKKPLVHPVNVHERCKTEIEFQKTKQWYIKVLDKKEELIKAADDITWYPEHMKVRYVHWVENLNWDWCISRQRHFGIPFPLWYCKKCGEVKLADEEDLPIDPTTTQPKSACKCGSNEFDPETDIMDTWNTSSLTPQVAANWKHKGEYDIEFKGNFPFSLRPQGHDIIRTWLFYTVVKAKYHNSTVPWRNVMISGHAQDPKGRKMSKSLGNVVEPMAMIDKYSADALRFWAAGSKLGDDLPFLEKDLVTGNKIITKLWNASKFVLMHLEDFDTTSKPELTIIDKWILSKFHKILKSSTDSFEKYEYAKTKLDVENFFWNTFCDNYLEICKDRLYKPEVYGKDKRESAQYTLYHTILGQLKLLAPLMPHITESIYHIYFAEKEAKKSIHISNWPEFDESLVDESAEKAGDLAVDIISVVRKVKSENNVSLKTPVTKLAIKCDDEQKKLIETVIEDIKATTTSENIVFDDSGELISEKFSLVLGVELGEVEKKE